MDKQAKQTSGTVQSGVEDSEQAGRKIKILLMDDVPHEAELINRALNKAKLDFAIVITNSRAGFDVAIKEFLPDVVLFNADNQVLGCFDAMDVVQSLDASIPFIVIVTNNDDMDMMTTGVDDYVSKDNLCRLPLAVKNASQRRDAFLDKISKAEQLNKELQKINNRLQLASKSAGVGIWEWDLVNNALDWDQLMLVLYQTDFVPTYDDWLAAIHPDDRERADTEIKEAIHHKTEYRSEFRVIWPNAEVHTIKAVGVIEEDDFGLPVKIVGLNWDVTERQRYINEIERRNLKLRDIAHLHSHAVRAPLARIMGLADLFNTNSDNEVRSQIADFILKSAHELDAVIREITIKTYAVDSDYGYGDSQAAG